MSMPELNLTSESLLSAAREHTGLHDVGSDYADNLEALLEMYRGAAHLTAAGKRSTQRRLLSLLVNRLRIERAFQQQPEIRSRTLTRPVYVVGLPRTGTSALFNLLARDPAQRALLFWEGLHPDPGPSLTAFGVDPRLEQTRSDLARAYAKNPEFREVHRVEADGPEECVALLSHSMGSVQQGIEPLISPYREYFLAQDQRATYRYYVSLLRLLDAQRPGERWLLKSPAHLWALAPLLEQLPDACIVWTHRDPLKVVASYCSMLEALSVVREAVDLAELGRSVLEYLAKKLERAMRERQQLPAARFFDVGHAQALREPLAVVERLYAYFGFEQAPSAFSAMRRYDAARTEPAAGQHRYSLERYGLQAAEVAERFQLYTTTFAPYLQSS